MTNWSLPKASDILCLEAVTRQFPHQRLPAVSSVSLTLEKGHLLALLGPSGCGKTTLLRLIAGFETPQQGKIAIAQQIVAANGQRVPPEQRGVGMVFQDYALFPHLTVQENLAFGLKTIQRKPLLSLQQRVKEVLALVGLQGLEDRYPHQLSGGQQQRVALARALAPHPFLVLLDEPLSNLDVQVRLRLRQELREILRAAGASAILVTHDQEEALSIADDVAVMRQGHIEQMGAPEEIYQNPASRFVAEFVTQANFLPAVRRGEQWETALGQFAATQVQQRSTLTLHEGDLMVRQEDVMLSADPNGKGIVSDRQFLGREYRYAVDFDHGQHLVARTGLDTYLAIGTAVGIEIRKPLMLFEQSSEPVQVR
jgi:iron(III) transport system ATP-binding protein